MLLFSMSATSFPNSSHDEMQYLDLVKKIIEQGSSKSDRTGVGTFSVFGAQMRFDLRNDTFPLFTTRRIWWRAVAEELLWFVRGCTDARKLSDKGIGIWNAHSSKDFLNSKGLCNREEGDLGPVYGFQWRHFGARYIDARTDYEGQGVDQLAAVIDTIKRNPDDRRMIVTAWNPVDVPHMALPPCHVLAQFYVNGSELSCQTYQRSGDMALGVPFNVATYSLLTCMIARCCDLRPGDLVHTLGDAHVYRNHVEAIKKQLAREPRPFPTLQINKPPFCDIDSFDRKDFVLRGYDPHPAIKMELAI